MLVLMQFVVMLEYLNVTERGRGSRWELVEYSDVTGKRLPQDAFS